MKSPRKRQPKKIPTQDQIKLLCQLRVIPASDVFRMKLFALRDFHYETITAVAKALSTPHVTVSGWLAGSKYPQRKQRAMVDTLFATTFTRETLEGAQEARAKRVWSSWRQFYESNIGLPDRSCVNVAFLSPEEIVEDDHTKHPVVVAVNRAIRLGMRDKIPNHLVELYNLANRGDIKFHASAELGPELDVKGLLPPAEKQLKPEVVERKRRRWREWYRKQQAKAASRNESADGA
jgi:hypothetical protein